MKIRLTVSQKILLVFAGFIIAVFGFMIKLPSAFRHMDKELHATFYFFSAAFLNVLFAQTKFFRHAVIFVTLYLFGMAIEYGQQYSNRFFRTRIHGRYDPEDLQYNLTGLLLFSFIWVLYVVVVLLSRKGALKSEG